MQAIARRMSWVRFDLFLMPGMECFELSHFQKMYLSVSSLGAFLAILVLLRAKGKLGTKTTVQVCVTAAHCGQRGCFVSLGGPHCS